MISSQEFILTYSELFKELEKRHGKEAVKKLWDFVSETWSKNLENYVKKDGLKGLHDYWNDSLGEEGGRYTLTLRDDEFIMDMHYCPSIGKLLNTHVEPYKDYCRHCTPNYITVIEKYGITGYFILNPETAECRCHYFLIKK